MLGKLFLFCSTERGIFGAERRIDMNPNQMTASVLAELRDFKQTEGAKYGIERLALVGSVARGDQQPDSDIDVCVKLQKTTFNIYMSIKEELERRLKRKVDLITLHVNMRQLFYQNLQNDAIYI